MMMLERNARLKSGAVPPSLVSSPPATTPNGDVTASWSTPVHPCSNRRSWRSALDVFIEGVRISGSRVSELLELFRASPVPEEKLPFINSHLYFVHFILDGRELSDQSLQHKKCWKIVDAIGAGLCSRTENM